MKSLGLFMFAVSVFFISQIICNFIQDHRLEKIEKENKELKVIYVDLKTDYTKITNMIFGEVK